MRFDLVRPCKGCPFRKDCGGYLDSGRAEEIGVALVSGNKTFACHQTTVLGRGGSMRVTKKSQHCAGALLMLEHMGVAVQNQMVRIAERLRLYDHTKLDMQADVVKSQAELIELHGGRRGRK